MLKGYLILKSNPFLKYRIKIENPEDLMTSETRQFIIFTLDTQERDKMVIIRKEEILSLELEEVK